MGRESWVVSRGSWVCVVMMSKKGTCCSCFMFCFFLGSDERHAGVLLFALLWCEPQLKLHRMCLAFLSNPTNHAIPTHPLTH